MRVDTSRDTAIGAMPDATPAARLKGYAAPSPLTVLSVH